MEKNKKKNTDLVPIDGNNPPVEPTVDFDESVLDAYPDSLKKEIKLTKEQKHNIKQRLGAIKHGAFAEIPLLCRGIDCPYAKVCPLVDNGISPSQINPEVAARCPIEIAAINAWTDAWVEALNADTEDFAEIYLIRDLVEAEIMQMRTNKSISINGFIKEVIIKVDPITQDAYKNYDISVPLEVKLRFKNLIYKIMDKFVATREQKIKLKQKGTDVENQRFQKIIQAIRNGDVDVTTVIKALKDID